MSGNNDLISRSALLESFKLRCFRNCKKCDHSTFLAIDEHCSLIDEAPTIEARQVVHGEWIETHEHKWKLDDNGEIDECSWFKGYCNGVTCEICGERICVHCHPNWKESKCYATSYKCSVCGYHEKEKSNFCLNCGADMRGGKNE